jgi:hypothetical protein
MLLKHSVAHLRYLTSPGLCSQAGKARPSVVLSLPGHIRALAPGWQQVTMSLDFNPWQNAQCARRTSSSLACDRVPSDSVNHSVVVSLALSHACDSYDDHVTTPLRRTTRSLKSNTT